MAIGIIFVRWTNYYPDVDRGRLFWVGGGASVTTAYNDS